MSNLKNTVQTIALYNAIIFCVSTLTVKSTFAALLGPGAAQIALAVSALSIATGIALSLAEGPQKLHVLLIFFTTMIATSLIIFEFNTGFRANFNIIFSFLPIFSFVLFINKRFNFDLFLFIFFIIGLSYSFLYILLYGYLIDMAATAEAGSSVKILGSDGVREARVSLSGIFAAFTIFYLITVLNKKRFVQLSLLTIPLTAVYFANSRLYSAILILTIIFYLSGLLTPNIRKWVGRVFLLVPTLILSAIVFNFNIFYFMSGDTSGFARYFAFDQMKASLQDSPLFGIGMPSSRDVETYFFRDDSIFWSDTGMVGIWFVFGLAGLVLFSLHAYRMIVGARPIDKRISSGPYRALLLTSFTIGLGAMISPGMWLGEAGIILGLVLALDQKERRWALQM